MNEPRTLGPWLRRFLAEHVVTERNLARNTQLSYRDTFVLLIPFVSARVRRPADRLALDDLSSRRGFATRLAVHTKTAARRKPSIARRKVTPHVLRHACALATLEATGDIRKVSLWLGHQSLKTTEMYLRTDPAEKLDMLSEWRSPGLGKGRFTGVKDTLMAMLSTV